MNVVDLINSRRLVGGPKDRLMCVNPLKHKWAWEMLDVMEQNTWFPKSISMGRDIQDYHERLDDAERSMYDKALAFLSNLDGIQFDNLINNIGRHITSPEVSMCIARQAYEEANHVRAYSTMIEAVSLDPMKIYAMYETDEILRSKNNFIMAQSDALGGEYSHDKFALAVVANIILEGIYFFSGFLAFYVLAKNGKMLGSADQIAYIQRDELTHLELFVHQYHTLQNENPEIFTPDFYAKARRLVTDGVELETSWGQYIISGGVLGVTDVIVADYIKHLANERVAKLGWLPLYPEVKKNPIGWVDKISAVNGKETNFFEGKPTDYQAGGSLEWE